MHSTDLLRAEVISLFEDNPSKKLPLIAFQYFFEKNFHRSLTRSDIRRLKDTIELIPERNGRDWLESSGGVGGKYIALSGKYKAALTLPQVIARREKISPFCSIHQPNGNPINKQSYAAVGDNQLNGSNGFDGGDGWHDEEPLLCLPLVDISLKKLAPRMHALLDSHSGCLPLNSLLNCYQYQFNESFNTSGPSLVPLEHLISCLPGIEISIDCEISFKRVTWASSKPATTLGTSGTSTTNTSSSSSHSEGSSSTALNDTLAKQMAQFSREVRDLLKNQPRCLIPFSKFVPAYHNHFGRQCCVYQYGYTKLIELLEAIPNVVQILGEGSKKMLTLTHREQTKRFASDLIRVLKAQPSKKLTLGELASRYEKVLEKSFSIENYGVCCITDILTDVWEGTVMITYPEDGDQDKIVIEIPRKERTPEEKERTKFLVRDIIELLQSTPSLSMPFSKFIPTYHHYFNRQCKVSEYGFTKLIELFESLCPEVVELEDNQAGDEKIIKLSHEHRVKTIGERLVNIVKNQLGGAMQVNRLHELFRHEYGHPINFRAYGVDNLPQLIDCLPDMLRLVTIRDQALVLLLDKRWIQTFQQRIVRLLMERLSGSMSLSELGYAYRKRFGQVLDQTLLLQDLHNYADIDMNLKLVSLNCFQLFARDCILAIQSSPSSQVTLSELADILRMNHAYPNPAKFGSKSFRTLIQSLSDYIVISKRSDGIRVNLLLTLNKHFMDKKLILSANEPRLLSRSPLENSIINKVEPRECKDVPSSSSSDNNVTQSSEIIDILSQSVPSNLPKPTIIPTHKGPDLITFDGPNEEKLNKIEKLVAYNQPCPPPPNDWLKSFADNPSPSEDESRNKNESRKMRPRRIAANFTAQAAH